MIKVTYHIPNRPQQLLGTFIKESDARLFVQAKLEWDEKVAMVSTCYRIYDKTMKLIHEGIYDKDAPKGKDKSPSFNPTPTPTELKPPGFPTHIKFDDEDEDDD